MWSNAAEQEGAMREMGKTGNPDRGYPRDGSQSRNDKVVELTSQQTINNGEGKVEVGCGSGRANSRLVKHSWYDLDTGTVSLDREG